MIAAPTAASALLNSAFWGCANSILWLPLAASWREPEVRRRRRAAAIALTVAAAMTGLLLRLLLPEGRGWMRASEAVWVWEFGFAATSAFIAGGTALLTQIRHRRGWWSHAEGDTGWDRKRWRLAPVLICAAAALVVGWAYNLTAVAAAAAATAETTLISAAR